MSSEVALLILLFFLMSHSPEILIMTNETNHVPIDSLVISSLPRKDSASESGNIDSENTQSNDNVDDFMFHRNAHRCSTDENHAYNLQPPPPVEAFTDAEHLADRLFSPDHLNIILNDATHLQRFTRFLIKYRSQSVPTLVRYLDFQKAIKAIQYANALIEQTSQLPLPQKADAAIMDPVLTQMSQQALEDLTKEALPMYITFGLVDVVTEMVDKEIIGRHSALPHEVTQGLAEVYCISDPTQPDNPIVFASEEFYSTTQYGINYVIGRNCRFLQGPKTSRIAIERIKMAVKEQQEISEMVLNYRRDGSPFFNLIMVAPLTDNKGSVRYFIGCQVDVTHLIEGGKGIDTFRQLIARDQAKLATLCLDRLENKPSLKFIRELGGLLSDEEVEVMRGGDRLRGESRPASSETSSQLLHFVDIDDRMPPASLGSKQLAQFPGVYQNYILVRPYPSLRIVFTSPTLRIPGLCQSKLEDHVGGPKHIRKSLVNALAQGIGVTAKIIWLNQDPKQNNTHLSASVANDNASNLATTSILPEGKPCWIHCTPLLGSDKKVGVIMIVIVDGETNTNSLKNATNIPMSIPTSTSIPAPTPTLTSSTAYSTTAGHDESHSRLSMPSVDRTKERWPTCNPGSGRASSRVPLSSLPVPRRIDGGSKLYAEYLQSEVREVHQRADSFHFQIQEKEKQTSVLGGYTSAKDKVQSGVPRRTLTKVNRWGRGTS